MAQTEQPVVNTQPPKASMTRRKLVRGAFALPAVATVHSGSALATSSSLRCLTNGPHSSSTDVPPVLNKGATEHVIYKRVELAVAKKHVNHQVVYKYYVSYADVKFQADALHVGVNAGFLTTGKLRIFDVGHNSSGLSMVDSNHPAHDGYQLLNDHDRSKLGDSHRKFAVLIFDKTGVEIVGVGKSHLQGHAASQSCWTSFGTIP